VIESLSNNEIIRLAEDANRGGEYEAARHLLANEMARRGLNLVADPTGFVDALEDWQPPELRAWTDIEADNIVLGED
jgi:hypothetical protein